MGNRYYSTDLVLTPKLALSFRSGDLCGEMCTFISIPFRNLKQYNGATGD